MQFLKSLILLLGFFTGLHLLASPPVPFSGKLAVDGTNFHGNALFSFSIVDHEGAVHWRHAQEQDSTIEIFVLNGRYVALLGGQGMLPLPADLFLKEKFLSLRVSVDLQDGQGMRLLKPDQPITSTPYALAAELARLAEKASVADGVTPGAITADMIDTDLLSDLNRTAGLTEITREMLPQDVLDDLNRTIGVAQLSAEVNEKLNRDFTLQPGSISKSLLGQDVLGELNRTIRLRDLAPEVIADLNDSIAPGSITLDMLASGVLADLNRTVRLQDLSPEVSQSINRSITLSDLDSQVITELNNSIATGSISLDQLSQQVRDDLNRTITKSMLSQEVLNELNSSSGGGGVVPGSLLAVPANQSAPSGYSLYQSGEHKDLVWVEKESVSVARYATDGVEVLGGKIYFVGGSDGTAKNIAERYDPGSYTWETLANMSTARHGVSCAVLEGKLYAIGGEGLITVEVFDPSSDSWTAGIALPSEVQHGTAITVNDKIYLVGGRNASGQNINQVLCFDPSTSHWSTKANMPTARLGMKLVWFENRIWAIGGSIGSATNKVESYDPATDTWQAEASLTTVRTFAVAWVANSKIYVGGGKDSSNSYLNSIEVYDPATKQWASAGNLPEVNWAGDAVVLNDKAYVVAGQTSAGVFSNKVFAADLNASVSGVFDLYRKDGNASSGVPVAEVADGSVTASKLSSEVSNALKPVVIGQPSSVVEVGGNTAYLAVDVDGVNLSYQWKKDGVDIAGATNDTLSITDLNASQHEGNYTVVVSNAFGSVTSSVAQIDVNGSLTEGLVGWWKFDETEGNIASDSSGNGNDGNLTNGPTWTEGKIGGALSFDGVDDLFSVNEDFFYGKSFTFSSWVNDTVSKGEITEPENRWIFAHGTTDQNKLLHFGYRRYDAQGLLFGFFSNDLDTEFTASTGWSFLSFTFDYTTKNRKIFGNGNVIGSDISPSNYLGTGNFHLGRVVNSNFITLEIDDLRIYDRAISAVEVKALYELGEQPVQESGSGTTTVVNGTVADGSITTNQLSEQILKYLKPEITQQPTASTIFADTNASLSVSAEGKYLTYQWKKNGTALAGETNATLTITDANATQHDGNYSLVVSNDFGSVESGEMEINVVTEVLDGLVGWWPLDGNTSDLSGQDNHGIISGSPNWVIGKIGGAFSFNGSETISSNANYGTQNTISVWCNFSSTATAQYQMVWSFSNPNLSFTASDVSLNSFDGSGNKFADFNTLEYAGQWLHFVTINTTGQTELFLNAQSLGNANYVSPEENIFVIGRSGYSLKGMVDEVRIYDRALSNAEVQALYQLGQ